MASALRFESVAFAYGATAVFTRLDLEVAEGEIVAVLGPNGTGKTTLLRLASGALAPDRGRIEIFGRSAGAIPPRERSRSVAVVPQESRPAFAFTALEVVRMGRAPHLGLLGIETARDEKVVREAMERTAVASLATRPFLELSGGERQRVVLARALAQEPRLLLLDEPTAFLDLKHRLAVYDLLVRWSRECGITVVLASHDLDLAARFADRVALVHRGAVAADGRPADVLTKEMLRLAYEVEAEIGQDPTTGRPVVIPIAPSAAP